jgi:hypothetical protein
MTVGIRCADHTTPLYQQDLALTSPTSGGHSVGIVRSRTKAKDFVLIFLFCYQHFTEVLNLLSVKIKIRPFDVIEWYVEVKAITSFQPAPQSSL